MNKSEIARAWCLERVGCPYLYGGTGQICTPSYRQARAAQYPQYAEKIRRNCPRMAGGSASCIGCRWADAGGRGRRAYDCAQLTRWCMAAVGITLVSGAHSQWTKTVWAHQGSLQNMPRDMLCLVYRENAGRMGHVGVYLGDGTVVHAKGHDYGVVHQSLSATDFTHYGIPAGLYDDLAPLAIQKGASGEIVKQLQEMLLEAGMALPRWGADGQFGSETAAAVLAFQQSLGLPETGACDAATWQALRAQSEKSDTSQVTAGTEAALTLSPGVTEALQMVRAALDALEQALKENLNAAE